MRTFAGIDEVAGAIGTTIGVSPWITIDQARIDAFAEVTRDHQWIHVDADRAAQGPFGSTIAHGFLTLSLISSFCDAVYRLDGIETVVNYGMDRVRFPTPVPVGSRLRGHVEFIGLTEAKRGRLLRSAVAVELEGSDRPACVAEIVTLLVAARTDRFDAHRATGRR
jgi:acyl dehydratase